MSIIDTVMIVKRYPKFFKCTECSTLVEALNPQCCDEMSCCGKPMQMLRANALSELKEKHMPTIRRSGGELTVYVGSVLHPMTREHSIKWVELIGEGYEKRVELKSGDDPIVTFRIGEDERVLAVYAYCCVHGLWRAEIQSASD